MIEQAKRLPDTNVILRYLLADEPHLYAKADRLFERVRVGEEKVIILESVIVECVYVLTKFYKVPKDKASEKLQGLLHYRGVVNDDKRELIEALSLFADKNFDIVDCILWAKARGYGASLVSFDERLKRLHEAHP